MSRFKNTSKYKHVVGAVQKKELWYPDLKPAAGSDASNGLAASAQWLAIAWSTPGAVGLLGLTEVGKRKAQDPPLIRAHSAAVCDMAYSPFDDNVLATASDDCTIKLWKIPQELQQDVTSAAVSLAGHKKRVDTISFHPSASNVLASGGSDKCVKIWDLEAGKDVLSLDTIHTDVVHSVAWNWSGNLLATVAKDKKIRVIDPRANQVVQSGEAHQGVKASRVVWLGQLNKLASTGFGKMRDRQFAIWDASNLSKPLVMNSVDSSTGVLDIFYDNDTAILYLAGKGDASLKAFEIQDAEPYYQDLTVVQSSEVQKSSAVLPKRACDLMNTEIARVFKLTGNAVVPVSFSVPRKTKSEFQEDLYPPTPSTEPALSAAEWFAGNTKEPKLTHLRPQVNTNKWWAPEASAAPATPEPVKKPEPVKEEPKPTPTIQVVRSSKFRHIGGKGTKPEQCYTNLAINPGTNNSMIRANPTYFCVPWQGAGGRVAVIPMRRIGRQPDKVYCCECGSDCLDFDFNHFDDRVLATVTEMAHLQIWRLPATDLTTDLRTPTATMKGHTRRVTTVDFHPTANNLVLTTSGDLTVRIWDIEKQSERLKVDGHTDTILNFSWNREASAFASACKDKDMRIVDPRANKVTERVATPHDGAKGFKVAWITNQNKLLSVGFSKTSERGVALWDIRKLEQPMTLQTVDTGAGIITPYYDEDIGVCYLAGKGDGNIRMYEITDEQPYVHFLTEYRTAVPANGVALLPKTMYNVRNVEIARWLKLCGDFVEPVSFTVPRTRMELFQDDLYPPTANWSQPALSADEWCAGETRPLSTISLQPANMEALSAAPAEKKDKKYDFASERAKEDSRFTKEKLLSSYYNKMSGEHGETQDKVLKQDLMEGVAAEEWD